MRGFPGKALKKSIEKIGYERQPSPFHGVLSWAAAKEVGCLLFNLFFPKV
jgi:hypothetical protein